MNNNLFELEHHTKNKQVEVWKQERLLSRNSTLIFIQNNFVKLYCMNQKYLYSSKEVCLAANPQGFSERAEFSPPTEE